jgi:hypothetical protein
MRGFGAGMCNAGSCSKAAEAVVRVGVEIHAKQEEKITCRKSNMSRIYSMLG